MKKLNIILVSIIIMLINLHLYGIKIKIKNIVHINGLSENSLIGYGIVVGLNRTGDSKKFGVTENMLGKILNNLGVDSENVKLGSKNSAFVLITAQLPPNISEGEKIDVTVSSIGDAKNIVNGVLLQAPLKGLDGKVYAIAQGVIAISDTANKNKTIGIIPNGAILSKNFSSKFINNNKLILSLKNPDFTTVYNIRKSIQDKFPGVKIETANNKLIEINIPDSYKESIDKFVSELGELEIEPSAPARIVINKTSGVIVINGDVKLSASSVSYKNLEVYIKGKQGFNNNTTKEQENIFMLPESSDIKSLISGLNKIGAKTADIISILYALKKSGALFADIIIE